MPLYEYRCKNCRAILRTTSRRDSGQLSCHACGRPLTRVWGFRLTPVMHAHHNSTTGTVISDRRQFEAELRRKSDEATERTGAVHNYVPADMSDTKALRVTEEGLKETYDRQVRTGELEKGAKSWL